MGSVGLTIAGCGLPAGPATATATVVSTPGAPVSYTATFANAVGNISFTVVPDYSLAPDMADSIFVTINFGTTKLEHRILTAPDDFSLIHEIGHHFDWHGHPSNAERTQWRSQQFVDDPAINKSGCTGDRLKCRDSYTDVDSPKGIHPAEAYANAFAAYILGDLSKFQAEKYTIIKNDIQSVP